MKINDSLAREITQHKGMVRGIDTMRFLSALWVVLYHGGRFPIDQLVRGQRGEIVEHLNKLPFNGVAAVVLFFIISGFCIHYPYVNASELNWLSFWCKRMVRILIPFFAVQIISHFLGVSYLHSVEMIFWTIYCEIFYYLCYPFLFHLMRRFGMPRCLLISSLVSLVIAILHARMTFIGDLSAEAWVFCLPMWLLGCQMAEQFKKGENPVIKGSLWGWRLIAIAIASTSMFIAHTHPAIGYLWTMPLFAVYSAFWLHREFTAATQNGAIAWLERLGLGGYSIYLTHKISITWADQQYAVHRPWYLVWPAEWAGLVMISLTFYWLIEYPSHRLSKFLGRKLSSNSKKVLPQIELPAVERTA